MVYIVDYNWRLKEYEKGKCPIGFSDMAVAVKFIESDVGAEQWKVWGEKMNSFPKTKGSLFQKIIRNFEITSRPTLSIILL